MLSYILGINEEKEIKERIIFDIEDRLMECNTDIEDPILFAEESHKTITQSILEQKEKELESNYAMEIANTKKISQNEHETHLKMIEERNKKDIKSAEKEGYLKGQDCIISAQAKKIVKRNSVIIGVGNFVVALLLICAIISFVLVLLKDRAVLKSLPTWIPSWLTMEFIDWCEDHSLILGVIQVLSGTVLLMAKNGLQRIGFLLTNKEDVKEKLKEKYKTIS